MWNHCSMLHRSGLNCWYSRRHRLPTCWVLDQQVLGRHNTVIGIVQRHTHACCTAAQGAADLPNRRWNSRSLAHTMQWMGLSGVGGYPHACYIISCIQCMQGAADLPNRRWNSRSLAHTMQWMGLSGVLRMVQAG